MFVRLSALKVNTPMDIRPGELRCPRCMSRDIVPSMPRGLWDDVMRGAGRIPRHCRNCGKRFHASLKAIKRDVGIREEDEKGRANQFTETGF
jgi:hypothetical protein